MYEPDVAAVTVTFKDGEVKTYRISAGPGIGGHLAREANNTGVLSLWNHDQSFGIPIANIRDWEINRIPIEEDDDAKAKDREAAGITTLSSRRKGRGANGVRSPEQGGKPEGTGPDGEGPAA